MKNYSMLWIFFGYLCSVYAMEDQIVIADGNYKPKFSEYFAHDKRIIMFTTTPRYQRFIQYSSAFYKQFAQLQEKQQSGKDLNLNKEDAQAFKQLPQEIDISEKRFMQLFLKRAIDQTVMIKNIQSLLHDNPSDAYVHYLMPDFEEGSEDKVSLFTQQCAQYYKEIYQKVLKEKKQPKILIFISLCDCFKKNLGKKIIAEKVIDDNFVPYVLKSEDDTGQNINLVTHKVCKDILKFITKNATKKK